MEPGVVLPLLFFFTALCYSMAGFAGGSTYLALFFLLGVSYPAVPQLALLCNLVVAGGGCYFAWRTGNLPLHRILPFMIGSIPTAYLTGRLVVPKTLFTLLLAFSLLVAGTRILFAGENKFQKREFTLKQSWKMGLPIGILLGSLSGMVGIGGGIFLAPILIFSGWGRAREIAGCTSLFILVNSLSGLLGQFSKGFFLQEIPWPSTLLVAVFLGGQLGSRLAFHRLPQRWMVRVTALLILTVSLQLIVKVL